MPEAETTELEELTHAGLLCCFVRHEFGFWTGYVGVPRGHPFFGHNFDDHTELKVHGRLTYSGVGFGRERWWFGFDCGHPGDDLPEGGALDWLKDGSGPFPDAAAMEGATKALGAMYRGELGGIRRPLSFAQREAKQLAEQLVLAAK